MYKVEGGIVMIDTLCPYDKVNYETQQKAKVTL